MKEVLAIYSGSQFKQYLMKSEVKYINDMCKAFGKIQVELVQITKDQYKRAFGK